MTKKNVIEMNLPKTDDLFSTQEERDNEKREYVKAIPLEKISDFPDCNQRAQTDGFAEQNGRDAERADLTCRY